MKEVMLEINSEEKEILQTEIETLSKSSNGNEKTKNEFEKLLTAIDEQKIDEPQLSVLSHVLELLLTTGKIRKNYSPIEEQKIFRLYGKTPARQRTKRKH